MNKKALNKNVGLFLVLGDGKYVFYKAYYTKDQAMSALGQDKDLQQMIRDLKAINIAVGTLEEEAEDIPPGTPAVTEIEEGEK